MKAFWPAGGLILMLGATSLLAGEPGGIAPFLDRYCLGCHDAKRKRGGVVLEGQGDEASVLESRKVFQKVARRIRAREMPPSGKPQPTPEEIEKALAFIRTALDRPAPEGQRDPGRVTIRRLNRAEYTRTVRDLLGIDFPAEEQFPSDDVGYGFDNIGDVLSLPPMLLEKYLAAAERIAGEALAPKGEGRKRLLPFEIVGEGGRKLPIAREALSRFAGRAYRRPATAAEVDRILALHAAGDSDGGFEAGIRLAVTAILTSPHFLFRVEIDPQPESLTPRALGDFELASRLSYFLWGSMPDDELFDLAGRGELAKGPVISAQARRMLADPKSSALVDDFAGQWLQLRNLRTATPDRKLFPSFDEDLRAAMRKETELFFQTVMREDRSVLEFLDSDWTFLNERLARHYGIAGVAGKEFRRVALADSPRGGVLTQASVLTVTSNPTRTSPVKRGKWVLEQLLGAPPPPPPPGVPELPEGKKAALTGTLRQRMEKHREDPACATCHKGMDPLGFGLENFDAIGAFRDKEGDKPLDVSGVLPDGRTFAGPRELKAVLQGDAAAFRRCLVEKMLTFALGRGLEDGDRAAVERISSSLAWDGNRFSSLVIEIVNSDPFRLRRGERGIP
jgi:uncharacterized protein DUF1592/uncharacterized protein DUF1588/uncharacterized protein DUF1587/uncharacterized protein DUF1585/uncharacterized protein DUF1595